MCEVMGPKLFQSRLSLLASCVSEHGVSCDDPTVAMIPTRLHPRVSQELVLLQVEVVVGEKLDLTWLKHAKLLRDVSSVPACLRCDAKD